MFGRIVVHFLSHKHIGANTDYVYLWKKRLIHIHVMLENYFY